MVTLCLLDFVINSAFSKTIREIFVCQRVGNTFTKFRGLDNNELSGVPVLCSMWHDPF